MLRSLVGSEMCIRDSPYLGFVGDLMFADTQGASDSSYDGLGTRYLLVYLEVSDL